MHERKLEMTRLAFGLMALPGGIGIIEEVLGAMKPAQVGIHDKREFSNCETYSVILSNNSNPAAQRLGSTSILSEK